jgi:hypothetical protein
MFEILLLNFNMIHAQVVLGGGGGTKKPCEARID